MATTRMTIAMISLTAIFMWFSGSPPSCISRRPTRSRPVTTCRIEPWRMALFTCGARMVANQPPMIPARPTKCRIRTIFKTMSMWTIVPDGTRAEGVSAALPGVMAERHVEEQDECAQHHHRRRHPPEIPQQHPAVEPGDLAGGSREARPDGGEQDERGDQGHHEDAVRHQPEERIRAEPHHRAT